MLFTKEELEVLEDINCYEDTLKLTKTEIDSNKIDNYICNNDYWDTSLCDWFVNWLNERIYKIKTKENKFLYFFDNSDDDINCDRNDLLKRLFKNYNIKSSEEFDEIIVKLQDELKPKPTKEEIDLLNKVYVYDNLYDLAQEHRVEEDLEEYISYFGNLECKFENWFFDNEIKCDAIKGLYLYIDSNDMFVPEERIEIMKKLINIFNTYNIFDTDDFEKIRKGYIEEE